VDIYLQKLLAGYHTFRDKYAGGDQSIMQYLSQNPQTMIVACCDSRVDPALLLQCDPGDLFVVRNIANIVPPYENDGGHHGTSAALEFGICYLHVKHLILLGHSQCGGIQHLLRQPQNVQDDFITKWVSVFTPPTIIPSSEDLYAKMFLRQSYQNCMTFPWISKRVAQGELFVHLWFFDIKSGEIFTYSAAQQEYLPLK